MVLSLEGIRKHEFCHGQDSDMKSCSSIAVCSVDKVLSRLEGEHFRLSVELAQEVDQRTGWSSELHSGATPTLN